MILSNLNTSFGIFDTTLYWLQSYLTNRTFSVRTEHHCSSSVSCTTGVPQGSVLRPLLFTAYISHAAHIAYLHRFNQEQYAADTQLFISLSLSNYIHDLSNLTSCIDTLHAWFFINGMALNPDKSETILLGTCQRAPSYSNLVTINVAGSRISRAANLVKPKIGRFHGPKIGRNSKHFHYNQRHTNKQFWTILTCMSQKTLQYK